MGYYVVNIWIIYNQNLEKGGCRHRVCVCVVVCKVF